MIDFSKKMAQIKVRFKQLENEMADPRIFDDRKRYSEVSKEHQRLTLLIACYDKLDKNQQEITDNKELLAEESDQEFTEIIKSDIKSLEESIPQLETELKLLIVHYADNRQLKDLGLYLSQKLHSRAEYNWFMKL